MYEGVLYHRHSKKGKGLAAAAFSQSPEVYASDFYRAFALKSAGDIGLQQVTARGRG